MAGAGNQNNRMAMGNIRCLIWSGLLCVFVVLNLNSFGQGAYAPLGTRTYDLMDRLDIGTDNIYDRIQTSVKPYRRPDIARDVLKSDSSGFWSAGSDEFNMQWLYKDNLDWVPHDSVQFNPKPVFGVFYRQYPSLYSVDKPAFRLHLNPALQFRFGTEQHEDALKFINSRGVEIHGSIDERVGFYFFAADNQGLYMNHVHDLIHERYSVFPGEGRTKKFKSSDATDYFAARGYIDFNISPHINLMFGQDKNFIGNGYRSLVLSDVGKDYLQLKINTRVWRIHYQNLFAQLADYRENNIADGPINKKYAVTHHLGVNVSPSLNLGLFESIVYGRTDSSGINEGFELAYLNPLIFYRSVEFNLGSIDNVIIGMDWKWNFLSRFSFYGQLIIDEFNFGELRSGDGWWANKFGAQAGIKTIDLFGLKNLDVQLEYNFVRPYTYSHFNTQSNYAHFSQPLAHPLGSNFSEFVGIVKYQPTGRLDMNFKIITAAYGADSAGLNYGGNIYLDNSTRMQDYDVRLLQGVPVQYLLADFRASWQFAHRAFADLRLIYRNEASDEAVLAGQTFFAAVGVRLNITATDFSY